MSIVNRIKKEPALVSGLVAAVIALAVAFGTPLSEEQIGAIMAVTAAVLALVVRSQVSPKDPKPHDDSLRA